MVAPAWHLRRVAACAGAAVVAALAPLPVLACTPPPTMPAGELRRLSDVIVQGHGVFAQARGGGAVVPKRVLKGAVAKLYPVRIDYRTIGTCPPLNPLVGREEGIFYLRRQAKAFFILKFERK